MFGNGKSQLVFGDPEVHRPGASSSAIKVSESQSTETKQDRLAYEMPTKAQHISNVKLDCKEDKGNALPGSVGQKPNSSSTQSARPDLRIQQDGTLGGGLKTSNSTGLLKTDATRGTRKDTKKDTEEDIGKEIGTGNVMAARPASAQGLIVPAAARHFTFRHANSLKETLQMRSIQLLVKTKCHSSIG